MNKYTSKEVKKILVYGVWDMIHVGHCRFLESLPYCDEIVVGVLSDKLAEKYKRKPIINENDRAEMVRNMGYFHDVFIVTEENFKLAMEIFKPDLVVHGSDNTNPPSFQIAKELGIKTKVVKYTKGISTTDIINRCKNA